MLKLDRLYNLIFTGCLGYGGYLSLPNPDLFPYQHRNPDSDVHEDLPSSCHRVDHGGCSNHYSGRRSEHVDGCLSIDHPIRIQHHDVYLHLQKGTERQRNPSSRTEITRPGTINSINN